jgi:hypothetical protein
MAIDLTCWWAVLTNGEWFVGMRESEEKTLKNLQKLTIQFGIIPNEKGQGRPHTAVLTYPWFRDALDIPEGALWMRIHEFNNPKDWAGTIELTEKLKLEQRAARAGLHLVGH